MQKKRLLRRFRYVGQSSLSYEDRDFKLSQEIPFLLEDKISTLGGKYEKAAEPWAVSPKYLIYDKNTASDNAHRRMLWCRGI